MRAGFSFEHLDEIREKYVFYNNGAREKFVDHEEWSKRLFEKGRSAVKLPEGATYEGLVIDIDNNWAIEYQHELKVHTAPVPTAFIKDEVPTYLYRNEN